MAWHFPEIVEPKSIALSYGASVKVFFKRDIHLEVAFGFNHQNTSHFSQIANKTSQITQEYNVEHTF